MTSGKEQGLFITLEGIEGAGKTTHMAFIADLLRNVNKEVVCTREPGGTAVGEKIREILLANNATHIHGDTELLLMFAARAQHLHEVIRPALAADKTVLCDRFTDSSYAYQAGGRDIASDKICRLVEWVHADLKPDLTLLFDLPVELGLSRAKSRNETDRFETEPVDFFQAVREAYLSVAKTEPERVKIINAARDIETIQTDITKIFKKMFEEQGIC